MTDYIDFDTHVFDPITVWRDYLDPQFRNQAPQWVTDDAGRMLMRLDDQIYPSVPNHPGFARVYGESAAVDRSGNDPAVRLKYMDGDGAADIHVIFPTLGLAGFPCSVRDASLAAAYARAYNRYISDYVSLDRRRLRAVILLPANHPERAAAEMRWAREHAQMTIAALTPTPPGDLPWRHPSRDPIWRTAEELGITLVFHETTTGAGANAIGIKRYQGNWPMIYLCTHVLEVQLAFADIILGGTLQRFPKLKIGAAEAHVHWLAGWLALMDQNFGAGTKIMGEQSGEVALELKPSDYFRRQCLLAAFPQDTMIPEALAVAPDSIVVCSDWPHPIAEAHSGRGLSLANNPDITPEITRRVLVDNPQRFL